MPNPKFLLATAERVVRYARDMFDDPLTAPPNAPLTTLLSRWAQLTGAGASSAVRSELVANYRATSCDASARAVVMTLFALSNDELQS
jgi:hypothetical protein